VGVAGLALVLAGVWALLRRRKKRSWAGENSHGPEIDDGIREEKPVTSQVAEKRHISELSSDGALSELGAFSSVRSPGGISTVPRSELDSSPKL
jgi:hypothetical protein